MSKSTTVEHSSFQDEDTMTSKEAQLYREKNITYNLQVLRKKFSGKSQTIYNLEKEIEHLKESIVRKNNALKRHIKKAEIIGEIIDSQTASGKIVISNQSKVDYANIFYTDITKEILTNLDTCVLSDGKNIVMFNGEEVEVIVKNNTIIKIHKSNNH